MGKKGSSYERQIAAKLSLWWSDGEREDLFWRSSQSGGRATVRGRKGRTTAGHCGDISATDAAGADLIKVLTIEIKRGYNAKTGVTVSDLLDKKPGMAQQGLEEFISQAIAAAGRAGSFSWLLIHRRDGRLPVCFFPKEVFKRLLTAFPEPFIRVQFSLNTGNGRPQPITIWGCRLDGFFHYVNRKAITRVAEEMK